MKERSKVAIGLKREERFVKQMSFTPQIRKKIVEDYLSSGQSKQAIWKKYTGKSTEHGKILSWMRDLGYCTGLMDKIQADYFL